MGTKNIRLFYKKVVAMKIVHCKKDTYDEYIGRPSILGNPFIIGKDGTRKEVIDKFRIYFAKRIENDPAFKKYVNSLKGKVLGCWCRPYTCHGDIVLNYLKNNEKITNLSTE